MRPTLHGAILLSCRTLHTEALAVLRAAIANTKLVLPIELRNVRGSAQRFLHSLEGAFQHVKIFATTTGYDAYQTLSHNLFAAIRTLDLKCDGVLINLAGSWRHQDHCRDTREDCFTIPYGPCFQHAIWEGWEQMLGGGASGRTDPIWSRPLWWDISGVVRLFRSKQGQDRDFRLRVSALFTLHPEHYSPPKKRLVSRCFCGRTLADSRRVPDLTWI